MTPGRQGELDVIIRRAPGWPDGSETLDSVARELGDVPAAVHLCALDDRTKPHSSLPVLVHRPTPGEGVGATCNRALAAGTAREVLVLDSTDVLMHHALVRMRGAFRDEKFAVCYGMVIKADGDLTSALPIEASRLEGLDYMAAASLWRRSALDGLGGWADGDHTDSDGMWDLWKRLSRSSWHAFFIPRPVVRQRFAQG